MSTADQQLTAPELARYCLWCLVTQRKPCYGPATHVVVTRSGQWLSFGCEAHRDRWGEVLRILFGILEVEAWVAAGCGYQGRQNGGRSTAP